MEQSGTICLIMEWTGKEVIRDKFRPVRFWTTTFCTSELIQRVRTCLNTLDQTVKVLNLKFLLEIGIIRYNSPSIILFWQYWDNSG